MYFHSFSIGFTEIPRALSCLNIFTIGCPFKCKGCQNPDLQNFDHKDRKILNINDIKTAIDNSQGYIQGICWLGGEPLFQFKELVQINRKIKELFPKLIITVFTGYQLDKIKSINYNEYEELLNANIDYIIDGQWNGFPLGNLNCNQKIYKYIFNENSEESDFLEISYQDYKNKI